MILYHFTTGYQCGIDCKRSLHLHTLFFFASAVVVMERHNLIRGGINLTCRELTSTSAQISLFFEISFLACHVPLYHSPLV